MDISVRGFRVVSIRPLYAIYANISPGILNNVSPVDISFAINASKIKNVPLNAMPKSLKYNQKLSSESIKI